MLSNKIRTRDYRRKLRKNGPTEVVLLLDASGSMACRRDETIREVNRYLDNLRKDGGRYRLTVKTFNTSVQTLVRDKDIRACGDLEHSEYRPDGWTALLDAVGETLDSYGYRARDGNRVLFVVVTDGQENHSRYFGLAQVRDMIAYYRSEDFQFVFLGDGPSAWQVGRNLGFNISVSTDWTNRENSANIYKGLTATSLAYSAGMGTDPLAFNTSSTQAQYTSPVIVDCACQGVSAKNCPIHGTT